MVITGYKDKHEYTNKNGITSVVYLMDCMDLLKQIPEKYFELAIVDPPYGIGIAKWDNMTPPKLYFEDLMVASKNQIIWGGNYFVDKLPITEAWICWYKKPFLPQQAHFELAWTSFDMKPKLIEYTYAGNAEGLKNVRVDYKKKSIHPAQKPENLYLILFRDYAKEGDKILDTHLGSQSSRIAAANMGFNFIGCELDKDYFDEGNKRFENAMKQQSLFTYKEQTAEQLNLL